MLGERLVLMFKWLGQRRETTKEKGRQLWGRDFKLFGQRRETKEQHKASSSASVRSVLKTAVADAEQIVASIKIKAQAEAEEESARIIAQANEEAEEIKRKSETAAEKETEDILPVANRKVESIETEVKQEALVTEAKVEELVQPREEVTEEKVEELVQPREEVEEEKVEEPVQPREEVEEEKVEEPVQPREEVAEEKVEEPETDLLKEDSQTIYAGEVELAIGVPVDLKLVSKLYNSLQTMPELRILHTRGSAKLGTTITVVLEKPIPLVSVISSKIPGIKAISEPPEKGSSGKGKSSSLLGKGEKKVKRIKLTLKK